MDSDQTKTVDVRLLVPRNVDVDFLIDQLVTATHGVGAPLGAVELLGGQMDQFIRVPSPLVATRTGVAWRGESRRL